MVKCPHCEKEYTERGIHTHVWRVHGEGKNHDPNIGYSNGKRKVWNKGLDINDSRVAKGADTYRKRIEEGLIVPGGGKIDDLSPFRWYLKNVAERSRKRKEGHNITLDYLKALWNSQRGACPYTGIDLILPKSTNENAKHHHSASLDRIDSAKGYLRGNVEFVCKFVNYGKGDSTKEETIKFIEKIRL